MKLIVIGGSAGSMEPLQTILADLPDELDAAVLVLRHSTPLHERGSANGHAKARRAEGLLTQLLAPHCRLPVTEARQGMPVVSGNVYVAPAGTHVIVSEQDDAARQRTGARARLDLHESPVVGKGRPSIDLALASAAEVFGLDCIGVVLSGLLDDGTEGALELWREDGTMIVQSPGDADQASMPANIIRRDHPDYVLPDVSIGQTLVNLVNGAMIGDSVALGQSAR